MASTPSSGRSSPTRRSCSPFEPSRIAAADAYAAAGPRRPRRPPRLESEPTTGRSIEIPVRYGGNDGPDLDERRGPTRSRRRRRSWPSMPARPTGCSCSGSRPASPTSAPSRAELSLPRRAEPRTSVPAGSVAIAAAPDGRLPGRDARRLAPHRPDRRCGSGTQPADPPARLAPGDRVRFVARLMLEVARARAPAHDPGRRAGLASRIWACDAPARPIARALAASEPPRSATRAEDAALEMTLLGGTFAVRDDGVVGLAGADMDARVPEEGRTLAPGHSHRLSAGTTLVFAGAIDGARTYLALAGGIRAELALGLREHRPHRPGSGASAGAPCGSATASSPRRASDVRAQPRAAWPSRGSRHRASSAAAGPRVVAVTRGPHADADSSDAASFDGLVGRRLDREPAERPSRAASRRRRAVGRRPPSTERAGDLVSIPMLPGADPGPAGRASPSCCCVDAPDGRRLSRAGRRHRGGPAGARPAPSRRRAALRARSTRTSARQRARPRRPRTSRSRHDSSRRGERPPVPHPAFGPGPPRAPDRQRGGRGRRRPAPPCAAGRGGARSWRRMPGGSSGTSPPCGPPRDGSTSGRRSRRGGSSMVAGLRVPGERGRSWPRPPASWARRGQRGGARTAGADHRPARARRPRDRDAAGGLDARSGRASIITERVGGVRAGARASGRRGSRSGTSGRAGGAPSRSGALSFSWRLAPRATRGARRGRRPRARAPAHPRPQPRVLGARRASRAPDAGRAPLAPRARTGAARALD